MDADRPKNPSDVKAFNNADFSVDESREVITTPAGPGPDGETGTNDDVVEVSEEMFMWCLRMRVMTKITQMELMMTLTEFRQ